MEDFFRNLDRWDAYLQSTERQLHEQIQALESEYSSPESSEDLTVMS